MGLDLQSEAALTPERVEALRHKMSGDPVLRTMMHTVRHNGLDKVALNHDARVGMNATFSHEIETGPATHQKRSGRCWMFAGLNLLREVAARKMGLSDLELSQAYLMFWDKFEKANYFLQDIIDTAEEPRDGRLVAWLLDNLVQDGGQWDMFVNLVEKYGVMPKWIMPETFQSSESRRMNQVLQTRLRAGAATIRARRAAGDGRDELRALKDAVLEDVYRILTICLGEPPATFDLEYRDRDKTFHATRALTPHSFYDRYVGVDLSDYVSVINAPTADKPYGRTFTVVHLGNVKGGRDVLYLNVPADTLKALALRQVMEGEPVYFGCDVGKLSERTEGILDTAIYDYEGVLGVPLDMTKAERLDYSESLMTHAMVFTGVNVVDGRPNRWKVENSWGEEPGKKGYFVMSDDWFDSFTYQAVVRKSYLDDTLRAALDEPPVTLPPWDPMGSLAR